MMIDPTIALRLQFLVRVLRKACQHLVSTDRRLFGTPFTREKAWQLEADADLTERVEAFVGRLSGCRTPSATSFCPCF